MKQLDLELIKLEAQQYTSELYLETPQEWHPYIMSAVEEIAILLSIYNMTLDDIKFTDIKEKYGELRMYYFLLPQTRDDLTDEQMRYYGCIDTIISCIVNKWEREVKLLIGDAKLPQH